MCIVTLKDTTTYLIDTDSSYNARSVVEYKLKDRRDYRKISNIQVMEDVTLNKNNKNYNSGSSYDGKELQCSSGWNYKWD